MKTVLIDRITLLDWRGASATYDLQGRSLIATGRNHVGKTTIGDAVLWALTGYDTLGRSDHDIKTRDQITGQHISHGEHGVELELRVDGRPLSLRRMFREIWETKRGTAPTKFSGHETLYWVNGVGVLKNKFEEKLEETIASPAVIRLLLDSNVLNSDAFKWQGLDGWKARRSLLVQLAGDVTDQDVINTNPELIDLSKLLGELTAQELEAKNSQERKKAIDQRKDIPPRIAELRRAEEPGKPGDSAPLQSQLQELNERRASTRNGGAVADHTVRLRTLEAEALTIHTGLKAAANSDRDARQSQITDLIRKADGVDTEILRLTAHRDADLRAIQQLTSELTAQRAAKVQKTAEKFEDFNFTHESDCPACGQPIPSGRIEEARAKARELYDKRLGDWNEARAKWVAEDLERGKQRGLKIQEIQQKADEKETQIAAQRQLAAVQRQEISELNAQLPAAVDNFDQDPTVLENAAQQEELRKQIALGQESSTQAVEEIDQQISEVSQKLTAIAQVKANHDRWTQDQTRITELEAQEQKLGAQIEEHNRVLYLLETFTRAKCALLTDRINSHFQLARWTLFRDQVNEGIKEICDITYRGLPPSRGDLANLGLDCVNALSAHFGISLPTIVENAEGVTDILPTGQQLQMVHNAAIDHLQVHFETPATAHQELATA